MKPMTTTAAAHLIGDDDDDSVGGRRRSSFFLLLFFLFGFSVFFFKPMPGGRTGIGSSSCKEMLIESTFMNSTVSSVPR